MYIFLMILCWLRALTRVKARGVISLAAEVFTRGALCRSKQR